MLTRRAARDEGFTLIELIMAIAIMAIISVALIGMLFAYVRNANETQSRLVESSDQQFVAAYWQTDVSSLGTHGTPSGDDIPTAQSVFVGSAPGSLPGSCAGVANPVVSFAWQDYSTVPSGDPSTAWSGATANAAVYYTKNVGSQVELWRRRCGGQFSDIPVAQRLTAVPSVTCSSTCSGSSPLPETVSITIVVQDLSQAVHDSTGYTTTVTADRRQR